MILHNMGDKRGPVTHGRRITHKEEGLKVTHVGGTHGRQEGFSE